MKTLITSLAIAAITFTTSVSATNVQLRPADDTFETKICFVAATQGLSAAYELVKENDKNVNRFTEQLSCNGKSLKRTARTFKKAGEDVLFKTDASNNTARKVRFVADEAVESKVCMDAVLIGVDAALEKYDMTRSNIICNNLNIRKFAKKFAGKTVDL